MHRHRFSWDQPSEGPPGAVGLAAGIALGAAISPTDPEAALAVGARAGLPPKLITIIEGEGLLNDATALMTLLVAATSGGFSLGGAVLRFLAAAAGGLLAGIVVAFAVRSGRPSAIRCWSTAYRWPRPSPPICWAKSCMSPECWPSRWPG